MYLNILITIFVNKFDLISIYILLNFFQHKYIYHFFSFLYFISNKNMLFITFQIGNKNAQLEK